MTTYPALFVLGEPRTEGSLVVVPARGAKCVVCGNRQGRAFARHDQSFELTRWRNKIAEAVGRTWDRPLHDTPMFLTLAFVCSRNAGAHEKDLDKLTRAVLDAIGTKGGGAVEDDRHIALVAAVKHHVGAAYTKPGVTIEFGNLEEAPHAISRFVADNFSDPNTIALAYTGPKPTGRKPATRRSKSIAITPARLASARAPLFRTAR